MGIPPPALAEALQGRYTLERELGRGGMATVYLATDLKHKRPVALKVLRPELAQSLGPERFQREIQLAARLQHPHILSVHDSGDAAGQLWFTMPFVEGESLRDRLSRQKQLPVEDAVRIAKEAAQALEYAHQHGVIHRDIKPENILLTTDGSALVADFGIARALGRADERLTSTGFAVGTPAYMSPEQASGERDLSATTDVYSLGCVLYEMLAGEPPFTGPTPQAILAKSLSGQTPRLRVVRPGVLEALERAVNRALAPVPADRFASAADLVRALAAPGVSSGSGTTVATPAAAVRSTRRRLAIGAAAALGLVVVGGAGLLWQRSRHSDDVGTAVPKRLAVLPFENLGDSADVYFAEGLTDAMRGKLAALAGLQVIASTSSNRYRGVSKSPGEIGRELGVEYILIGKVRWAKAAPEASRVQVSPELVQVATGTTKWGQPFDAAISDVFQVQGEIAARVADALNVALGAGQRQGLTTRPTENLAAYDAFLRGKQFLRRNLVLADVRSGARMFEEAVRLDRRFAEAWAELAITRATLSWEWGLNDELSGAAAAADRALALAPNLAEAHRAVGYVRYYGHRDYEAALAELRAAGALAPNDPATLVAMGFVLRRQGRWSAAIDQFERGFALDPQSYEVTAAGLGASYLSTRQYDKAETVLERAIAIDPTVPGPYRDLALVHIHRDGDTARAVEVVERAAGRVDFLRILFTAGGQLGRILGAHYAERIIQATSASAVLKTPGGDDEHELDPVTFFVGKAMLLRRLGRTVEARANFDSALTMLEAVPPSALDRLYSEQGRLHSLIGVVYAGLDRRQDAVRHGELGLRLIAKPGDAFREPPRREDLATIYVMLGDRDRALDQLMRLLTVPCRISAASVRLDPLWASFQRDLRFERLVAGN